MKYNDTDELQILADKHIRLFMLMHRWTRLLQDKKSVQDFFVERGYKRIAIYGFGLVGETLERELRHTGVRVEYIVDRNADFMYAPVRIVQPNTMLERVDVMVVTTVDVTGGLIKDLRSRYDFKVISVFDVIEES